MENEPTHSRGRPVPLRGLLTVFWLSGVAALVYEVLWLKQLGRLFGVTAYASSTTLAVFFLGLALGGLVWSRRCSTLKNPLRTYAMLELGVAVSALAYFAIFRVYAIVQEPLLGGAEYRPALALAVKFMLSVGILLLPSFLMGGTLPVMSQFLVGRREQLGSGAALLYTANTLGATVGALLAGFVLPRLLGFRLAYGVAIAINVFIALQTWWWSRTRSAPGLGEPPPLPATGLKPAHAAVSWRVVRWVAGLSGAATLALEVLWTRMASQVLQNSGYTFAIILATFLVCLAVGAALAHRLSRRARDLRLTLALLLGLSGILVAITPFLFQMLAGRLEFWNSDLGFWAYMLTALLGLLIILGPAVVVMGAVFPFLMRLSEDGMVSAGRTVGELASINTACAIVGSLAAGFVLLGSIGLWASIWIVAGIYLIGMCLLCYEGRRRLALAAAALAVASLLMAFVLDFAVIRAESEDAAEEAAVKVWQGPDGTVAVMRHGDGDLRLRVNSSYNLGTTASAPNERLQGQIPALLYEDPKSIFFLGLGTGITASGAVGFGYDKIMICELNSDVIAASREFFGPWLHGLFDDPRVRVIPEDGRTWLATHPDRYDLVVGDIFLSYKAGVGSLYTLEHFRTVRDRLTEKGKFVQWIPVFDASVPEFEIMACTMLEVFPSVTLWRRSFSPVFPVYALVGCMDDSPLSMEALDVGVETLKRDPDLDPNTWILHLPLAAYVANLRALQARFASAPLNTDDRTRLEYTAPITERNSKGSRTTPVLAWEPLLRYCEQIQQESDPNRDPYLAEADDLERAQVLAGTSYYGYVVMSRLGNEEAATRYLEEYRSRLPRSQSTPSPGPSGGNN